jgi:hypothetical protein
MEEDREDLDVLRAALAAAEARARGAETKAASAVAEATRAQAVLSSTEAVITALRLEIAKLRRALYGRKSERKARLLDQLELQLEELETARARTSSPPCRPRCRHRRPCVGSRAVVLPASRSSSICRASGW